MGNYDQFIPKTPANRPNFLNVLQKAAATIQPNQVGYEVAGGTGPGDLGMGLGMKAMGMPFQGGMNVAAQGEGMREGEINKEPNPFARMFMDTLTNPMTYAPGVAGGMKVAEGIGSAGNTIKNLMNPIQTASRLESGMEGSMAAAKNAYGTGLAKIEDLHGPKFWIEDPYAPKTVSFADELNSPKTMAEHKIFNSVKDEAAYQGIDINKLSPEESKNLMDIFKNKVGQHVVAGEVGPTEINQTATLSNLKAKQLQAFQEFTGIDAPYGPKADAYNAVGGKAPNILEGGGNRILKQKQLENLKTLDPSLFATAKNYRRGNAVLKAAKNPFIQAVAGFPIVGGAVKAILHEH